MVVSRSGASIIAGVIGLPVVAVIITNPGRLTLLLLIPRLMLLRCLL